jgi:hypothetical protein
VIHEARLKRFYLYLATPKLDKWIEIYNQCSYIFEHFPDEVRPDMKPRGFLIDSYCIDVKFVPDNKIVAVVRCEPIKNPLASYSIDIYENGEDSSKSELMVLGNHVRVRKLNPGALTEG